MITSNRFMALKPSPPMRTPWYAGLLMVPVVLAMIAAMAAYEALRKRP